MWRRVLTKCGDSEYLNFGRLVQYKDVKYSVVPKPVSRADQMNGVQWRGYAIMAAAVFRFQGEKPGTGGTELAWSGWYDGDPITRVEHSSQARIDREITGNNIVQLTKRAGKWEFYVENAPDFGLDSIINDKASCPLIPGTAEHDEATRKAAAVEAKTQADGFWLDSRTNLLWPAKDSGTLSYERAGDYCRSLRVGGRLGWRLASTDELRTLAVRALGGQPVQVAGGIRLSYDNVWSRNGASFDFSSGRVDSSSPSSTMATALCVFDDREPISEGERKALAGQPQTDVERTAQSTGLWTDSRTRLIWTAKGRGDPFGTNSESYCRFLKLDGRSDWRLPTIDELAVLSDPSRNRDFLWNDQLYQYHMAEGIILPWPIVWSSSFGSAPREGGRSERKRWAFDFRQNKRVLDSESWRSPSNTMLVNQILCVCSQQAQH